MGLRDVGRLWLPPALHGAARRAQVLFRRPDWEHVPDGWRLADPHIQGWNVRSVAEAQERGWPGFLRALAGARPLGLNVTDLDHTGLNPSAHNTVMSYAYALALAARGKERVSILDWGGGLGQYGPLSRALFPGLQIYYCCKDLPLLCEAGRRVNPDAEFIEEDGALDGRRFDLVLSSSSLHYSEDWRAVATLLCRATAGYLYITRLPVVERVPSFVVVQRPYACGYETEYLGWFLNRAELLSHIEAQGMKLIRELLIDEHPTVHNAPEQAPYRGFLFTPTDS